MQSMIDQGYREFLERVAESRGMTTEEVDRIARGRVWSGQDAFDLGLVDKLGTLEDALAAAAGLAGLGEDYQVSTIEKELEFKDQLLRELTAQAIRAAGPQAVADTPFDEVLRQIESHAKAIAGLNDPNHVYSLSMIETD